MCSLMQSNAFEIATLTRINVIYKQKQIQHWYKQDGDSFLLNALLCILDTSFTQ